MKLAYRRSGLFSRGAGTLLSIAAAGVLVLPGGAAGAQAKPNKPKIPATLVIYRGDSLQTAGLALANWGSGTVEEDTGKTYSGTESIRLTPHGLYQGGSLNFAKPVNVAPYIAGRFNYLTIVVQIPNTHPTG